MNHANYADRQTMADLREATNKAIEKYPHLRLHDAMAALAAEREQEHEQEVPHKDGA